MVCCFCFTDVAPEDERLALELIERTGTTVATCDLKLVLRCQTCVLSARLVVVLQCRVREEFNQLRSSCRW